jgi:aminomethyltransferase
MTYIQTTNKQTNINQIDINEIPISGLINDSYAGKLVQSSVLNKLHTSIGAKFCGLNGVEWVASYGDVYKEYCAVKCSVGMLDISAMTQIEFCGFNASIALQRFFTNNIIHAPAGQIRYGCLVRKDGRVLDDCMVYKFSDQHLWLVFNLFVPDLPLEISENWNTSPELTWREITQEFVKIQVQGPKAHTIIDQMYPKIGINTLPWFHFAHDLDNKFVIGNCGYSGEKGVEIFVSAAMGEKLWQNLQQMGVMPYGIAAIEHCRVEVGLITHNDYLPEFPFPQEIGMEAYVKPSVSHYLLGFEAIQNASIQYERWHLVFENDDKEAWENMPIYGNSVLLVNGQDGVLTSVAYSPIWQTFVGIAILPVNQVQTGDTVNIGLWRATVLTVQQLREKRHQVQSDYFKAVTK